MGEMIALDVHAHLIPFDATDRPEFDGVFWDAAKGMLVVDEHPIGMKALYRPTELIAWMDRHQIRQAWISAPPPLYRQHLGADATRAWSLKMTTNLDRIAASHGGRLSVLAHLPMHQTAVAADLAAARIGAGHRRFSAPAGGAGDLALSDPAFDPLWTVLDAARAFVFMHPGECADGRLSSFYLGNLIGNPYESAVALAHLVFGGVLERFPGIGFCFAHGGGAAPALAGRLEQGFRTARPGVDTTRLAPRVLMRRVCVDCITHDDTALDLAESIFGSENIVFGSDWPFPMGLIDPHRQLGGLTPTRRQTLFCDNPDRLAASTAPTGVVDT